MTVTVITVCNENIGGHHYIFTATKRWWRKSSNPTVGQSSLISSTHHFYDWHPGSRCSWTCNQLTSKVDRSIAGSRLRWSIPT